MHYIDKYIKKKKIYVCRKSHYYTEDTLKYIHREAYLYVISKCFMPTFVSCKKKIIIIIIFILLTAQISLQ